MKAVIVDDEKKGRETLSHLLQRYHGGINVVGMASTVNEAYTMILQFQPEVVFLDIEMNGEDGFNLLERFETVSFHVVFVTAYDHYAMKAIKHNALDYLLKPIDIDDLKKAIDRLKNIPVSKLAPGRFNEMMGARRLGYGNRLALPVKEGLIYLQVSEIVRVESDGSYSTFYTVDGKKHVVSKNLKEYEDVLPAKDFFRSHKSYLINIRRVKKFLRTDGYFAEMEDGSMVEISRRKKDDFLELMETMG